jgi:hypothetical protein
MMKCLEHVACIGEKKTAFNIFIGKPERDNCLEDQGVDWRII